MDQPDQHQINRPKGMLDGDFRWGLIWGLIIVFIGVVLLLDHMGIVPFGNVYRFWPLLLVLFGVMNLLSRSGRALAFLLIVAGVLLLLNEFGLIRLSFADIWPLAIISVGLLLIWGSLETRGAVRRKSKIDWTAPGAAEAFRQRIVDASTDTESSMNAVAIFGNCERRFTGQHFQGGKATSVFGGLEIDFRDADIDDEAVLEVSCVFGGIELRVPETWYIHSRSLPVFGGFEDKTRQTKIADPTGAKRKTLIVTGIVVFGGVEIGN
ncbi:MAG: LiaF transmembrane domain-containing protein [Candidatus Acidiferrales bacterium]